MRGVCRTNKLIEEISRKNKRSPRFLLKEFLIMRRRYLSKKGFLTVFLLIFIFLSFTCAADEKSDKVDRLFAPWHKPDTPGCAVAVVQKGKIIHKRGYGMANLEHSIPITPQSVFYIGSVSKQFVAICIAQLVKEGRLSLDDNISKHVPEMPDYGDPITVRHLIHHTSGLRDYLTLLNIAGIDFGTFHMDDVLELISRQKELNFKPGEEFLYSNSGYFLLAVIVERVSGLSLREYAQRNIFKNLGMKYSHFHDDYTTIIKNRASGYFPGDKGEFKNFISTFDCVGSGGLFTSVEDLILWDQNFYHYKVGGKDVIDLMHVRGKLNNGKELDYAFALNRGQYKGLETVSHGGALGGYRSYLLRFPGQEFSVIILSNLSIFNPGKLAYQVADIYLSGRFKQEAEVRPGGEIQFIDLPTKMLKEKVGFYMDRNTGAIREIHLKGGSLVLEVFGQRFRLAAVSESVFRIREEPDRMVIEFEEQSKGKPMLLHILAEGLKYETYEAVHPIAPLSKQLKGYTGDYESQELQVTFRLAVREGKLYFIHKSAPLQPLRFMVKDQFAVENLQIRFIRDEEGSVVGFKLDAGRVKNLHFDRRQLN